MGLKMKLRYLPLLFVPALAFAQQQQVDPFTKFLSEYNAAIMANQHAFEALGPFINAYNMAVKAHADAEAQKQVLIEWLKEAQAREAK
jgi:hypothetical protein